MIWNNRTNGLSIWCTIWNLGQTSLHNITIMYAYSTICPISAFYTYTRNWCSQGILRPRYSSQQVTYKFIKSSSRVDIYSSTWIYEKPWFTHVQTFCMHVFLLISFISSYSSMVHQSGSPAFQRGGYNGYTVLAQHNLSKTWSNDTITMVIKVITFIATLMHNKLYLWFMSHSIGFHNRFQASVVQNLLRGWSHH